MQSFGQQGPIASKLIKGEHITRKFSTIVLMLILSVTACDKDKPTDSDPLPSGKVATQDVPGKPGRPEGTATHSSVSLTWEAAEGADSYQVKRRRPDVDPVGTLHLIGTPTVPSFVDNTVEPETEYGYSVYGVNTSGVGPRNGLLKITTEAAPTQDVPGKPGKPEGTATHSSVSLTWEAAEGADSYQVKRRRPDVDPVGTLHLIGTPTVPSFVDNTVEPETEYGYSVYGVNTSGVGPRNGLLKITTEATPVENKKGTVTVEEDEDNSGIGVRNVPGDDNDGNIIEYVDEPGLETATAEEEGTPLGLSSSGHGPRGLTYEIIEDSGDEPFVYLTWRENPDWIDRISQFKVYRSDCNPEPFAPVTELERTPNIRMYYVDTSVERGCFYKYHVRAIFLLNRQNYRDSGPSVIQMTSTIPEAEEEEPLPPDDGSCYPVEFTYTFDTQPPYPSADAKASFEYAASAWADRIGYIGGKTFEVELEPVGPGHLQLGDVYLDFIFYVEETHKHYSWSAYDLKDVFLHELGHVLGLRQDDPEFRKFLNGNRLLFTGPNATAAYRDVDPDAEGVPVYRGDYSHYHWGDSVTPDVMMWQDSFHETFHPEFHISDVTVGALLDLGYCLPDGADPCGDDPESVACQRRKGRCSGDPPNHCNPDHPDWDDNYKPVCSLLPLMSRGYWECHSK